MEHFRLHLYGQPIEILTDHQALEPLINENRSNKTYSARLTQWLDRPAHFDVKINHIAGKHLGLPESLSRNPLSKPESIKHYDDLHITIIWVHQQSRQHQRVKDEKTRMDHSKRCEQKVNQSQNSHQNKLKSSEGKANDPSSLLLTREKVSHLNLGKPKEIKLDYKKVEQLKQIDPSAETLALTNRWKQLVKPNDHKMTNGVWKKYAHQDFTEWNYIKWLTNSIGNEWQNKTKKHRRRKTDVKNCLEW